MTGVSGERPGEAAAVEAARDAAVRDHHEAFRAAQRVVGVEPRAYDDLSDRTKRIKHQQLDPLADAAVTAAYPVIAEAVRAEERERIAQAIETRLVEAADDVDGSARVAMRFAARLARGGQS